MGAPARRHPGVILSIATAIPVLAMLLSSDKAFAQNGSDPLLTGRRAVLRIVHLNFDCHKDTIHGRLDRQSNWLPTEIRWGRDPAADSVSRRDDDVVDQCHDGIPPARRVASTSIVWPTWERRTASFAVQRVNSDSLPDLVIYLRGRVAVGREIMDSVRPLVIFGQHGLDTVPTIELERIGSFQTDPFIAMELDRSQDLRSRGQRDLTGRSSYRFPKLEVAVGRPDTSGETRGQPVAAVLQGVVRVYPNPSANATQVELSSLAEGRYLVEVVAVNGRVELRAEIMVASGESILHRLDVSRLAAGYYIIRVGATTTRVGAWPIIITR